MERNLEIRSLGSRLLEPLLKENLVELQHYFLEHRMLILNDFQKSIEILCREAYELQLQEQNVPVMFFSISYLRHCVYTQKHEVRLDLYNEDFYFAPHKISQHWDMTFLFQFFEKDMEYFKNHIRVHYRPTRRYLREYEEKEFALWYIRHYYKIAECFFRDQVSAILDNENFRLLEKTEDFLILYGGYMEEQSILFQSLN